MLQKYTVNGVVNVNGIPVQIDDLVIEAYSRKQVKFKLAFKIKERFNDNVTMQNIFASIKRAHLTISG